MIDREPTIAVGLVADAESVSLRLLGDFRDAAGRPVPRGTFSFNSREVALTPIDPGRDLFALEATIGIDFHWQQRELQTFCGRVRLVPRPGGRVTVVNDVPLEAYLVAVVCSEMRSSSPPELVKAHAIVSRSWLLAQLQPRDENGGDNGDGGGRGRRSGPGEIVSWTDRQAHDLFDVCADDHCQRYQGVGRIQSTGVAAAVAATRGRVLTYQDRVCDARFHKCCGGVTEDFTTAWGDEPVPYLSPVLDGPQSKLPEPPLGSDTALRVFLDKPPEVYCNCSDENILEQVLNRYDRDTRDFFRWRRRLGAEEAGELVRQNLGVDLGRMLSLEPVERSLSGRLKRLRLVGQAGSLVIGKELLIRRALSPSHLYSSAFVVHPQGPAGRPEAFVLRGAGWGHGVGLCQIGAAVMAWGGRGHEEILGHYYPGTALARLY